MSPRSRPQLQTTAKTRSRPTRSRLFVLCLLPGLSGCYAGAAGVAAGILSVSDGGGSGNSPAVISDVEVTASRTSPALIRFRLTDAEANPLDVEISYQAPGNPGRIPVRLLDDSSVGVDRRLSGLETLPDGVEHRKLWDFGAQVGDSFQEDFVVTVTASVGGASASDSSVRLGNDQPRVGDVHVALDASSDEVVGIALLRFRVVDTSDDPVNLQVEYRTLDAVGSTWALASPAAITAETPQFAFEQVLSSREGVVFDFFWNVVGDLGPTERDVEVRVTPFEELPGRGLVAGLPAVSPRFRVDNNAAPVIQANSILQSDHRRGITLPFTVSDSEGDDTIVFAQWRRPAQSFDAPPLQMPTDADAVLQILADPHERRRRQVCSERPVLFEGRSSVLAAEAGRDPMQIRLPELGTAAASLASEGLTGRRLEILRASTIPQARGMPEGLLESPVAIAPLEDGQRALIVDSPRLDGWRLQETHLGSGDTRVVANGAGRPTAMALGAPGTHALLATLADTWSVQRIDLTSATSRELFKAEAGTTSESMKEVRGIVSRGRDATILSVGSSILQIHAPAEGPVRVATLATDLRAPHGIALLPGRKRRLLVAERDLDRILSIDLATLERTEVVTHVGERAADASNVLKQPRGIALERRGARLLIVADHDPADGSRELLSVDLGANPSGSAVDVLTTSLPEEVDQIATGSDLLRLLAVAQPDGDVYIGGGLEQTRTVAAYDPATQTVTVERPFSPRLDAEDPRDALVRRWRIADELGAVGAGASSFFVWDSEDVLGGGEVLLRLTALDSDLGIAAAAPSPVFVFPRFDLVPRRLATTGAPGSVSFADFDQDGDLDLVSANRGGSLTVFCQKAQQGFEEAPTVTIDDLPGNLPGDVVVLDVNADGWTDVAVANPQPFRTNTISLFLQDAGQQDLSFVRTDELAIVTGDSGRNLLDLRAFEAADLDQDGQLDFLAVTGDPGKLSLIRQDRAAGFESPVTLPRDRNLDRPTSLAVTDLNQDGALDVVVGTADCVTLFVQNGEDFGTLREAAGGRLECENARDVVAADLDADGTVDLIAADGRSDTLTLLFQEVAATPTEELQFSRAVLGGRESAGTPTAIDAADLDQDGHLDIVSANEENFSVYFQRAEGFDAAIGGTQPDVLLEAEQGDFPQTVTAVDLDGDGSQDLVSGVESLENSDGIRIFLTARPGMFDAEPDVVLAGLTPEGLAVGDLDGNGYPDLVVGEQNQITAFFQTAPGEYGAVPPRRLGSSATNVDEAKPVSADLNGDGRLDIVAANKGSDKLTVFYAKGDRRFGTESSGRQPAPDDSIGEQNRLRPEAVVAADLDRDGRLDLISANLGSLGIYLQTPAGTFGQTSLQRDCLPHVRLFPRSGQSASVAVADLSDDGLLDIVSASPSTDRLDLFFQRDDVDFGEPPEDSDRCALRDPHLSLEQAGGALLTVDLDADGRSDLVAVGDGRVAVFLQPSGGFAMRAAGEALAPDQVLAEPVVERPGTLAAADFDGDGDLDLLVAAESELLLFVQTAGGRFATRSSSRIGGAGVLDSIEAVAVADLDRDGDQDVIAALSRTVAIFFGR